MENSLVLKVLEKIFMLAAIVSPFVFAIVASIFLFCKPLQKYKFIFWFLNVIVSFNLIPLAFSMILVLATLYEAPNIILWIIFILFVLLFKFIWLIPFYEYTDPESSVHNFLEGFLDCALVQKRIFIIFIIDIVIHSIHILLCPGYGLFLDTFDLFEIYLCSLFYFSLIGFGVTSSYIGLFVYLNIKKRLEKKSL